MELMLSKVATSPLTRTEPLWRVLAPGSGRLVGYVESLPGTRGPRYRAGRLRAADGRRIPLGEFTELDDALRSFSTC